MDPDLPALRDDAVEPVEVPLHRGGGALPLEGVPHGGVPVHEQEHPGQRGAAVGDVGRQRLGPTEQLSPPFDLGLQDADHPGDRLEVVARRHHRRLIQCLERPERP